MNEIIEFWKGQEPCFNDCRLDSYYMVMKYMKKEIDPARLFISSNIVNEQCLIIKIRYQNNIIKTPIIQSSERCFEENLCKCWHIGYQNIQSEDIDEEIQLIKSMINKNKPVITEVISLFMQDKNLGQKGTVISGITTIAVIGYDLEGFTLGTKDAFSKELEHISYEQYRKARLSKCIPYMPQDGVVILANSERNSEALSDSVLKEIWCNQIKKLQDLCGLEELNTQMDEYVKEIAEVGMKTSYVIIKKQLMLIAKSLCKGSYGGYYYELANSGFQVEFITENQMNQLKDIGLAWKKCYFVLERLISNLKSVEEIHKFHELIDILILTKKENLKKLV